MRANKESERKVCYDRVNERVWMVGKHKVTCSCSASDARCSTRVDAVVSRLTCVQVGASKVMGSICSLSTIDAGSDNIDAGQSENALRMDG